MDDWVQQRQQLIERNKILEAQVQQLTQRNKSLDIYIQELSKKNEPSVNEGNKMLEDQIQQLIERNKRLIKAIGKTETKENERAEKLLLIIKRTRELEAENNERVEQVRKIAERNQRLAEEIKKLEAENATLQQQQQSVETEFLKAEIEELKLANTALQTKLDDMDADKAASKLSKLSEEELKKQSTTIASELQELQLELDNAKSDLATIEKERDLEARKFHPEYNKEKVAKYDEQLKILQTKIAELAPKVTKLKGLRTKYQNQLKAIEEWKEKYPGRSRKIKGCISCNDPSVKYQIEGTPLLVCSKQCGANFFRKK